MYIYIGRKRQEKKDKTERERGKAIEKQRQRERDRERERWRDKEKYIYIYILNDRGRDNNKGTIDRYILQNYMHQYFIYIIKSRIHPPYQPLVIERGDLREIQFDFYGKQFPVPYVQGERFFLSP